MIRNLYARFIFAVLVLSPWFGAYAQSPGGVAPAVWYRADDGVFSDAGTTPAADNATVQQWNSVVGNFPLKQPTAANRPGFSNSTTLSNFNPTVTFTGANSTRLDYLVADNGEIIDRNTGTLFSAGKTSANAGLFGFGANMDYPGIYITGNDDLTFLGSFGGNWATDINTPPNAQGNFVGGGGWLNGAGPGGLNLVATSYNGRYFSYGALSTWNTNVSGSDGNLSVGYDLNWAHLTGQQNEMIVFDSKLTDEQMNKVESYLAIKYGQTLSKAANRNYLASDGSTIWDGTANQAHYHNVFGLGRQDVAVFDQRVSKSVNTGTIMTVAADNDFASPNQEGSRRDFAGDETYFLLGDNDNTSTTLADITAGSLSLKRIAKDWLSQRTSSTGTLHLSTDLSGYGADFNGSKPVYMIIADDAAFTSNVRTVAATLVNGEWVTSYAFDAQAAKQYITYGFAPPQGTYAPGGVATAAWYRADAKVYSDAGSTLAADASGVAQWNEFNDFGYDLKQATSANRPVYSNSTTLSNFNPTVTFAGGNNTTAHNLEYLVSDNGNIIERTTGTLFSAGKTSANAGLFGFGANMDYPGIYITGNDDLTFLGSFGGNWATDINTPPNAQGNFVGGGGWLNGAGPGGLNLVATSYNGRYFSYDALSTWNTNVSGSDGNLTVGRDPNHAHLVGQQNEIMVFDSKLTDTEMNKVESYLAIKWGQTLSKASGRNYVDAGGNIIWDGAANQDHYHNVFGLGRQDIGAFDQRVAKSVNMGAIMTVAADNDFASPNLDGSRRDFDGDETYFLLGDNNNSDIPTVSIGTSGLDGIQKVWLAQRTSSTGNLHFSTDLSAYGANFSGSNPVYMIIADDAGFTTNVRTIPATLVGGEWVSDYGFDSQESKQYITYGFTPPTCSTGNGIAPGGVTNGLSYWYRADRNATNTGDGTDVTAWQDAWSHTTSGQIGSAALPKYKTGAVDYFNFNAGVNFTAINQVIGNTSVQTLFNTDFDIFILTKEGMIGDRYFNVGVNNTLASGFNWDQPAFTANGGVARRNNVSPSYPGIGYVNPGSVAFSSTHSNIAYHKFNDEEFTKALNGAVTATPFEHGARGQMTGGHLFGSNAIAPWNGDDNGFIGHIGETIVYGCGNLSDVERRRVDTYLAIKYGLTLGRTETDHYLAADASIVWNGGTNTAFNNNIFGVAREDIGGFAQKASKSVNPGTIMTIATTDDFVKPNDDEDRRDFDNNETYFILGDNANTATPTVEVTGISGLERIQRVWLSQRTDEAGDLHFSTDLSGYGANFDGSKYVYMIVADDEDFTENVRTIAATFVGGQWISEYDFDAQEGNQYITYGYADSPLPVSWLYFTAEAEGSVAQLKWATVSEKDNAGFDVERSADGRNWAKLGFVSGKGANGVSETRLDYSFTDAAPLAGKNYYRLKQIDLSGSYEYSRLVMLDVRSGKNSLLVYPNPVAGGKLTLKLAESEIRSVAVFSISGVQMRVGKLQSDNTFEIGNLPAGQYFVRVTGKNGEVITRSFIVK